MRFYKFCFFFSEMTTFLLKVVDQDLYLNIPDCQETKVILGPSKCKGSILVLEQGLLKSTERPHLYLIIENGSLVLSRDKKKAWKYDEIHFRSLFNLISSYFTAFFFQEIRKRLGNMMKSN